MGKNEGDEDINNINNIHTVNNDENQLRNRKQSEKEGNEILQEEDKSKEQNKYETINVLNNRLKKLKRILPLLWCVFYPLLLLILLKRNKYFKNMKINTSLIISLTKY